MNQKQSIVESDLEAIFDILNVDYSFLKKVRIKTLKTTSNSFNAILKLEDKRYFIKKEGKRQEHQNLQSIQSPTSKNLKLTNMVGYDERQNLIVFEYVEGENFLYSLLKYCVFPLNILLPKKLFTQLDLIARWLAEFHANNIVRDNTDISENIDKTLNFLGNVRDFLDSRQKKTIKSHLESYSNMIPVNHIIRTNKDFSARNIIISKENIVTVVDWEKIVETSPYHNLAYFLTNIESRARFPFYSIKFQQFLANKFVEFYQKYSDSVFSYEKYRFWKFLYHIEYIHDYENKVGVFEPWTNDRYFMTAFIRSYIVPWLFNYMKKNGRLQNGTVL